MKLSNLSTIGLAIALLIPSLAGAVACAGPTNDASAKASVTAPSEPVASDLQVKDAPGTVNKF